MSGFKNFIITFLVAALVFGTVAYFVTEFLTETITGIFDAESSELDHILRPEDTTAPPPEDTTAGEDNPDDPPALVVNGKSFNMLFIVTDYQPGMFDDYFPDEETLDNMLSDPSTPATGILGADYRHPRAVSVVLFRADKERQEFTYTVFPSITKVTTAAGEIPLGDLYHLYGTDFMISTINAMTGISVDYHLLVNITELYEIVNTMGSFTLNVPFDLYYNGTTSTTQMPDPSDTVFLPLLYPMGENPIDGTGTIALTMWEDFSTAATFNDRNTLTVNMMKAIFQKLLEMPEAEFSSFYDMLIENGLIETSFTTKELVATIDLIYAMKHESFAVKTVSYPGRFIAETDNSDAYFAPNTSSAIAMFKNYRKILTKDETDE